MKPEHPKEPEKETEAKRMEGKRCHKKRETIIKCSPIRKRIELFYLLFILTTTTIATLFAPTHQQQLHPQTDHWTRSATDVVANADGQPNHGGQQHHQKEATAQVQEEQDRRKGDPVKQPANGLKVLPAAGELHSAVNELAKQREPTGDQRDFGGELSLSSVLDNFETLKIANSERHQSFVPANETTSKPKFTSFRQSVWNVRANASLTAGLANNRSEESGQPTADSSDQPAGDSINGNRTTDLAELAASMGSPGGRGQPPDGSNELIGVHNYLQFGDSLEETPITTGILPPTRNLNAALEAQSKLTDAMIQLHYNKSLSFEKMNSSELQTFHDETSLLPSSNNNGGSEMLGDGQQLVSVSPTQEPSSRIEWTPKAGPVGGQPGGADLMEAAGEIHQQQRKRNQQSPERETSSSSLGDWGRRKPSNHSDLITWTPAAGPAAYKAGSPAEASFTGPLALNGSDTTNTQAADYSEQSESRQSFETRSRPKIGVPPNENADDDDDEGIYKDKDSRSSANRWKNSSLGTGSKRLSQSSTNKIKVLGERRKTTSDHDDEGAKLPPPQSGVHRTKKVTSNKRVFSRPLVELPKAPPPDPDLEEDANADDEDNVGGQVETEPTSSGEGRPTRGPLAKVRQSSSTTSKPTPRAEPKSGRPAKRRQQSAIKALPVVEKSIDIPQPEYPHQEETEDKTSDEDDGERKTRQRSKKQKTNMKKKPKISAKEGEETFNIKWSPQTSFDSEPNRQDSSDKSDDSNQQEASGVVKSERPVEQFSGHNQDDLDNNNKDDENDGSDDEKDDANEKTTEAPIKERRFVSGTGLDSRPKPPIIRTFRLAEQGRNSPPAREFSSPEIAAEQQQQPRSESSSENNHRPVQHVGQTTTGGFSPQSSLPATLVGRPAVNFQRPAPATTSDFVQRQQQHHALGASQQVNPRPLASHFNAARAPSSSPSFITSGGEPFNEGQASSQQQGRFQSFGSNSMVTNAASRFQQQPQQAHYARPANQSENTSAWSVVTFPYPQRQQSYRPSSQQYPPSSSARVEFLQLQDTAIGTLQQQQLNQPELPFIRHMPAPQLDPSYSSPASREFMSQPAASQFVQTRQQQPLLVQRGVRQVPMSSHQQHLAPLTIRLDTRGEPPVSGPVAHQSGSPFSAESYPMGQQPTTPPRMPLSNGHLPPQLPRSLQDDSPMMRRPTMSSFGGNDGQEFLQSHAGRTNGHAYAGQLKLPQMSVVPSAWLHANHLGPGESYDNEGGFISPHFGSASEYSAVFHPVGDGSFFPMPSSQLFDNSLQMQQLAAAAAMPASVFVAPQAQPTGAGGSKPQSQFVKKGSGVTPISAVLPLATPARVQDAFGWPMGYGSEAAKTLLKVNHVAPPPAYLIPDKVSEAQASALLQPTMIEPSSGKGKPPRVSPLQEDSSIIQQHQLKQPNENNLNHLNHGWMMGQHSMLRPQVVWPQQVPLANQPARANRIEVALSTRPPASLSRRAKLWQRLRSIPFGRHRSSPSSESGPPQPREDKTHRQTTRFKRGIADQVNRLVTLRRNRPHQSSLKSHQNDSQAQKFALIESGSSQQTFIPLIDNGLLESEVLNRALAYNSGQPAIEHDPMMTSQSDQVSSQYVQYPSYRPMSGDLELAAEQQQQQNFYVPASLEPPANEPPSKLGESNNQRQTARRPTGERLRLSISRSLSKPLSRIRNLVPARWFPASPSNHSSAAKNNLPPKQLQTDSSQVRPLAMMSVAQQLSNIASPSAMMSHQVGSLQNFARFALPLQQHLLQQAARQPNQVAPSLLPLASHSSRHMSPYSFVVAGKPMDTRSNANRSNLMQPMAAASNSRPISWQEPPQMLFAGPQQFVGHNNLRRSEFDQYLAPANGRQSQQRAIQEYSSTSIGGLDKFIASPRPAFAQVVRHYLRPSPRMQQDAAADFRRPTNSSVQLQLSNRRPAEPTIREPARHHRAALQQQQQQHHHHHQQQEMFVDLSPSQLNSLAQVGDFDQEPMLQSLMASASNSIQADSQVTADQKSPLGPQTTGDFPPTTEHQQPQHYQPAFTQVGLQQHEQQLVDNSPYSNQQAAFVGANQAGYVQGRPRLPKLLPSINSMASKFRQHLFHTFKLNNNPLLSSMISQRPASSNSATYISPSYVTYPNHQQHNFALHQQHHLRQQQQQQQLLAAAPTNYLAQPTFSTQSNNFVGEIFSQQPQRPQVQQQQRQPIESSSIPVGEQEIVYEPAADLANGTQIIHLQPSEAEMEPEPGQVVEMYEQTIEPAGPNSIQQVQAQNGTRVVGYEQAQREESSSSDGPNQLNHDANLIASDGTYIQEEDKSEPQTDAARPNVEELRNKTNITVHHHHVIADDTDQQQQQPAQQQQDEQHQDHGQPINGTVIETTHQQHYEPERIQLRQPPKSVQLFQVGGRKVSPLPGGRLKVNRFVDRHNSTTSATSERADYQTIRASPTSLSQQASRTATDDGHTTSVFVKLINGTIEPMTAPSRSIEASDTDNSIEQQQQETFYGQSAPRLPDDSSESDQQQQAGMGEIYEPANDHDQQPVQPAQRASPVHDSLNRTSSELNLTALAGPSAQLGDDLAPNDLHQSSQDIARHAHNFSQPIGTGKSDESPPIVRQHDDHYVLVDQPVILAARPQIGAQLPPIGATTNQTKELEAGSSVYEPPMVFVSAQPERVIQRLPPRAHNNSYELNRKRPLKRPKGESKATKLARPAASEIDGERASELSASHSAQIDTTARYKQPPSTPSPTTLRPSIGRLNKTTTSAQSAIGIASTTERASGAEAAPARVPPKSRIRWQGANGRTTWKGPPPANSSELSSLETSRREQAWMVSSMTHQAYSNQAAPQTANHSSKQANSSRDSSRTNPIELLAETRQDEPPNSDQHGHLKQHNSSYSSEPTSNMTALLPISNGSPVEQSTTRPQTVHRIYANPGSIARANGSSSNARRHATEPRGRFQTFKSSLSKSASKSPGDDWPPSLATSTVAPLSATTSPDWAKSRTAPTSFRLSAATSQQPAVQQQQQLAAPMVDGPAATTPLSSLAATPPSNGTRSEFSARSDVDATTVDEDLTSDSVHSGSIEMATSPAGPVDDSMAWLAASLDDTRDDRLASLIRRQSPLASDLAQQQQQQHQQQQGQTQAASLQIKIAPASGQREDPAGMISFSQLRHTND